MGTGNVPEPRFDRHRSDDPETKAHRALDAALDLAFERGRLTGLRDARDNPDRVDSLIHETESWL